MPYFLIDVCQSSQMIGSGPIAKCFVGSNPLTPTYLMKTLFFALNPTVCKLYDVDCKT